MLNSDPANWARWLLNESEEKTPEKWKEILKTTAKASVTNYFRKKQHI